MFGWFKKDPVAELQKQYEDTMRAAMALQRNGDIPAFARKHAEAEALFDKLQAAKAQRQGQGGSGAA